ncbi:DALR anticodon-binding domain-containing protein [Psychroflexus salarius]|uniref:DALR anticodon-binding domain-containing protein n=1 Tax=Psychroflexus salarius TaxID=1155689 RepID=UPI0009F8A053
MNLLKKINNKLRIFTVKTFNNFYQNCIIIDFDELDVTNLRLSLAVETSRQIKKCFNLLGIEVPTRM